jgi:NhaP-type Na+/H+ or K+/H+ antiporter
MTHESALNATMCAVACVILVADAIYVASRWTGPGSTFNLGFAGGAVGLLLIAALTRVLRSDEVRPLRDNLLVFAVVTVLFIASDMFGVGIAPVLGAVGALAAVFPLLLLLAGMRRAAGRD